MSKLIHLHGAAKARFGGPFRLEVRDAAEAVRALSLQLKGFRQFLADGYWRVVRGKLKGGRDVEIETLGLALGLTAELHFIPVPQVAGKGGIGKILVGVALVAASFFVPGAGQAGLLAGFGPTLFGLGLSVGLAGVSQLIAKTPKVGEMKEREANPATKLFNGPVNLTEPGNPYPLALGRKVRTGSVVGQAGLSTEQL